MTHRPFTQAWADALRIAINGDAGYRAAAAGWTWPVALVLEPAPHLDYVAATAVELVLEGGQCTAARHLDPADVTAPFVLRAPYSVWKRLVRGTLDPLMAVALRHVHVQGSLTTLLTHAAVAKALIACARTVPVEFPDEQS